MTSQVGLPEELGTDVFAAPPNALVVAAGFANAPNPLELPKAGALLPPLAELPAPKGEVDACPNAAGFPKADGAEVCPNAEGVEVWPKADDDGADVCPKAEGAEDCPNVDGVDVWPKADEGAEGVDPKAEEPNAEAGVEVDPNAEAGCVLEPVKT